MTIQHAAAQAGSGPMPERLTGEAIFDASGRPSEPSVAMAFEPAMPVPTMLVQRELNYLKWLASRTAGTGRVVELGCFLGGSTSALVAGLEAAGGERRSRILTYDSFETLRDTHSKYTSLLGLYGLEPGTRFRDRFDSLNSRWLDRISVREGWLPGDATRDDERGLYPEQEPVELLFVDVAKTWDTHLTVLRTFGRHLLPGSIVVQQDFFDLQTPWIPLHMWQLRGVLRPLDVLRGTPTLGLDCIGEVSSALGTLWSAADLQEDSVRRDAWDRVLAYWADLVGPADAGLFWGHAAMHAIMAGDIDDAVRCGRRFEAWSRSAESNGVYFPPAWPEIMESIPADLAAAGRLTARSLGLAAECVARGSRLDRRRPGERGTYRPFRQRCEIWGAVAERLRAEGHRRVALFGAGRHTAWLLGESILADAGIEVECVIDDEPAVGEVHGVPVVGSEGAASVRAAVILPSSDTFEPRLMTRLHSLFPGGEPEIVRVYTDAQTSGETDGPNWEYTIEVDPERERAGMIDDGRLLEIGADRAALGLEPRRAWISAYRDRFRVPAWCDNYVHAHEMAFIWDVIEAVRPETIVEIGTASGVSTAMLAAAADRFCGESAAVHSFDIATECYFDRSRALGSAVGEMAPDLLDRVRLYARANATDAASCFPVGGIGFAFIDGDHGHPAPALDLLAMLYALGPGAWVVLHDIELCNFTIEVEGVVWPGNSGPSRLFEAWPFEKIQPGGASRADRNLGAIRMPDDPESAVPHLLGLLGGEAEAGGVESAHARRAVELILAHNGVLAPRGAG